MRQVGLLTQPLRVVQCLEYFNHEVSPGDGLILVLNPAVVPVGGAPDGTVVERISSSRKPVPSGRPVSVSIGDRVRNWARGGSLLGRWASRFVQRMIWSMRFLDRMTLVRRMRAASNDARAGVNPDLMYSLGLHHQQLPFSRVVVFDLFDLPTALEFGDAHGLTVIVR